jgi:hypothetical protein
MPQLKRIKLWIEVDVDPAVLIPAAHEMHERMWGGPFTAINLPDEVQAFFEAILGSTLGPHPEWLYTEGRGIDYGGEILGKEDVR